MILLSNCLTDVADEGCLKVANSLTKRIKQVQERVTVVSTARRSGLTDIYLDINKFLISGKLIRLIRKSGEPVLYIPFPTRSLPNAIRIFWLSLFVPKPFKVVFTMTSPYNRLSKMLLKWSKAQVYALSKSAADFYETVVGPKRVTYLKTGVDTDRFVPTAPENIRELKGKYGLDPDKKVVLHVGHMKAGRNIGQLMKLDSQYQVLLVTSTFTTDEQDLQLRQQMEQCENIKIIDYYLPNIEQIYQLADVYFFPVLEQGNCIDIPLSCLEAAACGTPVVMTAYGEMREFVGKPGFYFMENPELANQRIAEALEHGDSDPRSSVLEYDWKRSVQRLLK